MRGKHSKVFAVLLVGSLACGGAGEKEADRPSGPIDAQLAARGEELFRQRGCNACHTLGEGRLVGPDLSGVTERREYPFVIGMITSPDSMLTHDETARAMLAEYATPMADQGVTREEARALYEFFRRHDSAEDAGGGGE